MTATVTNDCPIATDGFLKPLMDYVISATGLMYYSDRRREFASHVASRIEALQINGCLSYLQFLQNGLNGRAELDRLITLLTIGETHFFRHRELFQALERTVLPALIEKNKRHRRLRIWSAGCSIGAEAYSLSMLLRRHFAAFLSHWDVRIVGTDINRDFLARAAAGKFEDWALRAVSAEERDACFSHDGKRWTVKPRYQQGVSFEYHNLASPKFSPPIQDALGFDLILCRNVMIYFANDLVRQSIKNLHDCLAPDGWLVVGHAEHNVDWFRSFRTQMSDGAVLYQKQEPLLSDSGANAGPSLSGYGFPPASDLWPLKRSAETSAEMATPAPCSPTPSPLPDSGVRDRQAECEKQNRLQEIRELADRGELEKALLRCEAFQRADAQDPSPHFYQALILQQVDDAAGAEQSLKRALYLDRNCLLAHYYLGLLLQKQGYATRATRSFQNVLKLLTGRSPHELIADADELTVADLERLSAANLDVLEQQR